MNALAALNKMLGVVLDYGPSREKKKALRTKKSSGRKLKAKRREQ